MATVKAEQVKRRFEEELADDIRFGMVGGKSRFDKEKSEFLKDIEYAQDLIGHILTDLYESKRHYNETLRRGNPYRPGSTLDKLAQRLVRAAMEMSDELEMDLKEPYHIKYFREIYVEGVIAANRAAAANS